jgi:hypothetical protein
MIKNYMLPAEYKRQYDRDSVYKMFVAEEPNGRISMDYCYLVDRKYYWFTASFVLNDKNTQQQIIDVELIGTSTHPVLNDVDEIRMFDRKMWFVDSNKVKEMNIYNLKIASEQCAHLYNAKKDLYDKFLKEKSVVINDSYTDFMDYRGNIKNIITEENYKKYKSTIAKIISVLAYMQDNYMGIKADMSVGSYHAKHRMENILGEYVSQDAFAAACQFFYNDKCIEMKITQDDPNWNIQIPVWYDVIEELGGRQ